MKAKKIARDEIVKKIENKEPMVLVEALPAKYYRKEHLPGAVNIPHDEIERLAPELLTDRHAFIVVYCASPTCENSGIAANKLMEMGYTDVSQYEEGKQGWKEAGLKLVSGRRKEAA
ncbi:MAG: rhodanese-like domain-containing protein [Desulfobacteraceae bacterium]